MLFVHNVSTSLNDQQIIVPDHLLEKASTVLQQGSYRREEPAWYHLEFGQAPHAGTCPFPKGIHHHHRDVPFDATYFLEPIPTRIILLPQSYYGLDARCTERFQILKPLSEANLDPLNAEILVPKHHTFLEGLVKFIVDPPHGLETPHINGKCFHDEFINNLVTFRVQYLEDELLTKEKIYPAEREILQELQTEDARWYLGAIILERRYPKLEEVRDYTKLNDIDYVGAPKAVATSHSKLREQLVSRVELLQQRQAVAFVLVPIIPQTNKLGSIPRK
ncbi:hypothetical protein DXG01_012103 [Tephrocybe rancida]|nr:hypothetical protein DXG01_012103 [Tephrocybe rancida]